MYIVIRITTTASINQEKEETKKSFAVMIFLFSDKKRIYKDKIRMICHC